MSETMTDEQVSEVLARFEYPEAHEITIAGGHLLVWPVGGAESLDDFGVLRRSENAKERHPLYTESLDACRRVELKLQEGSKVEGQDHHQAFLDLLAEKELQANVWLACTDPALVAHALAEVLVERGLV